MDPEVKLVEEELYFAAKGGEEDRVVELLKENPDINVNWQDAHGLSPLHEACRDGHVKVISILLAHPDIKVNITSDDGSTPFIIACANCMVRAARQLILDPRVDLNERNDDEESGLNHIMWIYGREILLWWIASGREIPAWMTWSGPRARKVDGHVTKFLGFLERDPEGVRHFARAKTGWYDLEAAKIFALVIFLGDGLLKFREGAVTGTAARFFRMAGELPMELQMELCHRVLGSVGVNISGEHREEAFRQLASTLLAA